MKLKQFIDNYQQTVQSTASKGSTMKLKQFIDNYQQITSTNHGETQ